MEKLKVNRHRGSITGEIRIPISKYHLHRALIMGSLAEGETTITGVSDAEHIQDTLRSLKDLGVKISRSDNGYTVEGGTYYPRNGKVRVGSSGSTLQFLLGLGSLSQGSPVVYDGHQALRNRPIGPLLNSLGQMGVKWTAANNRLPVKVQPVRPVGGHVQIQGTLSQWISGLLLLAPFAEQDTIIEALPPNNELTYIELTIQMMRRFGIHIEELVKGSRWRVPAHQKYQPCHLEIEADLSSAAYSLVLAALHPADIVLKGMISDGTHPEKEVMEIVGKM